MAGRIEHHQAINSHTAALKTDTKVGIERIFETTHIVGGKRIDDSRRTGLGAGLREDQLVQEYQVIALLLNQLVAQIARDLRKLIIQPLLRCPDNQ